MVRGGLDLQTLPAGANLTSRDGCGPRNRAGHLRGMNPTCYFPTRPLLILRRRLRPPRVQQFVVVPGLPGLCVAPREATAFALLSATAALSALLFPPQERFRSGIEGVAVPSLYTHEHASSLARWHPPVAVKPIHRAVQQAPNKLEIVAKKVRADLHFVGVVITATGAPKPLICLVNRPCYATALSYNSS